MARSPHDHIDVSELDALVSSPELVCDAHDHVSSCDECARKVERYRQLFTLRDTAMAPTPERTSDGCEIGAGVDWFEVVAGQWPALRARQLIVHASQCDSCGPLLRIASRAQVTASLEPTKASTPVRAPKPQTARLPSAKWLVPVFAMLFVFAVVIATRWSSSTMSGTEFAEFAAQTHGEHIQGALPLAVRSNSNEAINEWFHGKLPIPLTLPASAGIPTKDEERYAEGAQLLRVRQSSVAYVAYQTKSGPASLLVVPDSVVVASGGVEAHARKLTFHYATVKGFKVVTWTVHSQTYALVSQEGNNTQESCMVCHSAMRDRDLTDTPTPLAEPSQRTDTILQ